MPDYERTVVLPSRGLLYNGLLSRGELEIRSMTTQEEKLLASSSGVKMLDNLFKRCCKLPEGLPPAKLLVMDRFSLLLHLRVASYGSSYQISYNCASCGKLNYEDLDIAKDVLAEEVPLEEDEPAFEVELPVSGKVLTLIYPTGEDEEATERYNARNTTRKGGSTSDTYEFRLARQIQAIDGLPIDNFVDAMNFVRKLSVRDGVAIRDTLHAHEFGASRVELSFSCKSCNVEQPPTLLPVSKDFFRLVSPTT